MTNRTSNVGVSMQGNRYEIVVEIDYGVPGSRIKFIIATTNQPDIVWWEKFVRTADPKVLAQIPLPLGSTNQFRVIDGERLEIYRPMGSLAEELKLLGQD